MAVTEQPAASKTLYVALAGNPNAGKSTIFNILTGLRQHVANWPGKTVERREGTCHVDGYALQCVDLPGTYSLTAHSAEEVVARDYILTQSPDAVVVVVDASNAERGLYLVAQILDLTHRVVVALNMMDLARVKGYRIFPAKLQEALGVPVVPMVARRAEGVHELSRAMLAVGTGRKTTSPRPVWYRRAGPTLAALRGALRGRGLGSYPADWTALKMLEGDREVQALAGRELGEGAREEIDQILLRHEHGPAVLAQARYAWVEGVLSSAMERPARSVLTLTDRIDRVATHRFLGLPVLLAIFLLLFLATFRASSFLSDLVDRGFAALGDWVAAAVAGGPTWLASLLSEGIIPGVGGVLTFVPVILILFIFLGVLEDSGYMARAAFVMDRLMHAMGLHGEAFLSLLVAYGCNVPGIMATRILDTRRDRLLAILVNPLIPCAARTGVAACLVGAFFPPILRTPVMASLYALSLGSVIAVGYLLRHSVLPGARSPFMMELPLYRLPSLGSTATSTAWRLLDFLKRAGPLIVAVSVVIWLLSSCPAGASPADTYLGRLGQRLEPAGKLLGLDWRMTVALVTGFAAKETSLATLGVLYHAEREGLAESLRHAITPLVALVFVVVQLLYVPCLATVAVMRSETGSWWWTALGVLYPLVLAGSLGMLIFQVGRLLGFQ
jgi:ferrous iron transport protein B